jgi:hypothetical protein
MKTLALGDSSLEDGPGFLEEWYDWRSSYAGFPVFRKGIIAQV